jgi:hypothetical protein
VDFGDGPRACTGRKDSSPAGCSAELPYGVLMLLDFLERRNTFEKRGVSNMACACQGKVNNTNGRCPACNEAIYHNLPTSKHSCSYGRCS